MVPHPPAPSPPALPPTTRHTPTHASGWGSYYLRRRIIASTWCVRTRMQQRPISGSQLCRTAKRRQQRPQTSLGFIRKPDHPQLFTPSPPRLVGFDLREYFRLHGSSAGLRVGVNGRPSGDAALRSYVEDCRLEAIVREAAEKEKEEDDSSLEWERLSQSASPAPLCWQAQVKTEARYISSLCSPAHNLRGCLCFLQVSVRVPSSPSQTELKTKDTNVKNGEVRRIREKAPHSSRQSVEKTTTATEKFPLTQGRRCQCEELEDEDTTDLRGLPVT